MNKTWTSKCYYEFGPFQLNATMRLLLREEKEVSLTPKLFDTLLLLVEHSGEVMERQELIQAVWHDACVEEGNLSTTIYTLRKALGDTRAVAAYIATVPRRGYRFIAPVKRVTADPPTPVNPVINSLAVLPFKSLGGETAKTGLGLGITDALITRLSNLRQLSVYPTSAIRKYNGWEQDAVVAGRELDADAVVEGNIQWADERVRVTVQLVDVGAGTPLWAAPFDEPFTDIFSIEDAISQRVAEALTQKLLVKENAWRTAPYAGHGAPAQEHLKAWL
jgi:DNA-binding winged helix-turn-helix (wHTH) protein